MVGYERANWFSKHPSACTCVDCQNKRKSDLLFEDIVGQRKIGRNESCPCGSELKYKKCHGS